MSQNISQIFPLTPNVGYTRISAANTARDGSGSNIAKCLQAGANGDLVTRITATESDATASSTSVAQNIRVFLQDTTMAGSTLSGVTITGTAGQFSCTTATGQLSVGDQLTISGTLGGSGTITGYSSPTTYFVVATNGSTTFTLSTTAGGTGVVTTAGTPSGLTYTIQPMFRFYTELLMPATGGTTSAKGGTIQYTIPGGMMLNANWAIYCTATLGSTTTGQLDIIIESGSY